MNETHEWVTGDIGQINRDCIIDLSGFVDDDRKLVLGESVKVVNMTRGGWLAKVQFKSDGYVTLIITDHIDFIESTTPNDTTRYECDLFAWAGVVV